MAQKIRVVVGKIVPHKALKAHQNMVGMIVHYMAKKTATPFHRNACQNLWSKIKLRITSICKMIIKRERHYKQRKERKSIKETQWHVFFTNDAILIMQVWSHKLDQTKSKVNIGQSKQHKSNEFID